MSSELKKRIFTGLIGSAALSSLLVYGNWLIIFFLVTLLSLCLVYEFANIVFLLPDQVEKKYVVLFLTWILSCLNLLISKNEYFLLISAFLSLFVYFLLTARRHKGPAFPAHFLEMTMSVFAMIYLVFLPFYLRKIYDLPSGTHWVLLFLFINWGGDSGAYFAGKWFGKSKLYSVISPKKTKEGAWGGLLTGLIVAGLYKILFFHSVSALAVILISIVVGITAQVGDLCESFLKRAFNTKDSGSVLPGHGGLLDRFDGVVFSLPVMYACIRVFT